MTCKVRASLPDIHIAFEIIEVLLVGYDQYRRKTIILPVVLYGCETWEECRLRLFKIRILMRIFGPNRYENWEWRGPHNEELRSLYRLPNIVRVIKSRRLRLAGHVARLEEDVVFSKF